MKPRPKFVSAYEFSKAKGAFVNTATQRTMTGLVPFLTKHMWPHYSYRAAQVHAERKKKPAAARLKHADLGKATKALGKRVMTQLAAICAQIRQHKMPLSEWASSMTMVRHAKRVRAANKLKKTEARQTILSTIGKTLKAAKVPKAVRELQARINPYTALVIDKLVEMKLDLLAVDLPVGSADLRLATAVDLVCRSADEKEKETLITLVEVKCGFDSHVDKDTGHMLRGPVPELPDSPENQHQMQLLFSWLLFYNNFPAEAAEARAVVVRVARSDTHVDPLPDRLRAAANEMLQWVSQLRAGNNKIAG